eukprot:7672710-Alexandrium_andersonii.AAC.1
MSASLVGSEMCIRDSLRALAWQLTTSAPPPPLGRSSLTRGAGSAARSVSYTHLTLPTICSV